MYLRPSLVDLALEYGTDKQGVHSYAEAYERYFERLRSHPVKLLEIGIGGYEDPTAGGASLRMWKAYFPTGSIFGLDIYDKSGLSEDRITVLQGDQGDSRFLDQLGSRHGPFDIVIDDGSHLCGHVIGSFRALFPHVANDGIYVIEDLQTSYWDIYRARSGMPRTSMELLKNLADGLNHAEFDVPNYQPSYFDLWVESISLFHNIAFIEKGPNIDGSNILPPHPRSRRMQARPSTLDSARSSAKATLRKWFRREDAPRRDG